ncbi:NADPH:adrenodoxin oxidoreductase, mitochondrial isoform X2 [Microplitis demolitor]|uniref:NADPH:adrenodoxin oxidoreductase, mitochondrial isoform X2 n=1 Tax=Microplitis demolitor TaxID=69319 RepID=UPI0004CCB642|nr:NADPH:adrenodoxin oxidoreductase, mitochondrial isoform X2 [Microplitis demolitor]
MKCSVIMHTTSDKKNGRSIMSLKMVKKFSHFSNKVTPRVCIVGSGPAGFYACQQLLKLCADVHVDILERLPVPYGLVRFGVAPDHPKVKNVINTFHKIAKNSRVNFMGNINVGEDITVEELKNNYHAVLLAYGSDQDKVLGIPGETLNNVISGRQFVGWYNGVPFDKDLKVNLDTEEALVVGQGNVALDIARILLTPIDELKKTDITSYALEQLSQSRIRKVWLVGRRGPLQAAFTTAELREISKMQNCTTMWRSEDFQAIEEHLLNLPRPKKRMIELMLNNLSHTTFAKENSTKMKILAPIFFRSPKEIIGTNFVQRVILTKNNVTGDNFLTARAVPTCFEEEISCGLVIKSIGYKSVQIDKDIPFDQCVGRIINSYGKVKDNLYAAGWAATGPTGVILSTMTNAFQIGNLINQELDLSHPKVGTKRLIEIFKEKNVAIVRFEDWEKIDKVECERGKILGKPREKIVDIAEMLKIALS